MKCIYQLIYRQCSCTDDCGITPKPMIEHIKTALRKYKKTYDDGVKEI